MFNTFLIICTKCGSDKVKPIVATDEWDTHTVRLICETCGNCEDL